MAAALIARRAGASLAQIASAAATFAPVEHRLEFVRNIDGVDYYNDSKATSVDATLKAIDAFPGGLWIILGGKDKDSDFTVLREPLRAKARAALLIGAAAPKIAQHLGDASVPVIQCGTLAAAVDKAARSAAPGHTVLLAPACASFDQFETYEHRGRVFKELVNALAEGRPVVAQQLKSDWVLFGTVVAMACAGLVMVYSASSVVAELNPHINSSYYYAAINWFGRRCPSSH